MHWALITFNVFVESELHMIRSLVITLYPRDMLGIIVPGIYSHINVTGCSSSLLGKEIADFGL